MKIEVYTSVEEMKLSMVEDSISPVESLMQCLNLLDFYATLNKNNKLEKATNEGIEWIELKFKSE
ncbi:MAG: hypothetical protein JNM78_09520 [Cyclobacteriaceae bacterium]|nr:hypothetical protein [Cyclobacteriaceae bacterium]